jgi:opacity protein-like surface antigen
MEIRTMKRIAFAALVLTLASSPSWAGSFGVYGAGWDTKDADTAVGGGVKARFGWLDLHATYFADVTADTDPEHEDFEISSLPLEVGFAVPVGPRDGGFSPYLGAGGGYYKLDTDHGDVDDETGWYGLAGADFGDSEGPRFNLEVMYRRMEATVTNDQDLTDPNLSGKVNFDLSGVAVNAGLSWTF